MEEFILSKMVIPAESILTKDQQAQVAASLKLQGRCLIHKELNPFRNDYFNDQYRGSVELTLKCKNYSFHLVKIPDGAIVYDCNFTQQEMNNPAIVGKNITFVNCNLTNILIDKSWVLKECQIAQIDFSNKEELKEVSIEKEII